jgi:hypothetical protein
MQIEYRRAIRNVAGESFPLARFHVIASTLFRHPERSEVSRVLRRPRGEEKHSIGAFSFLVLRCVADAGRWSVRRDSSLQQLSLRMT